MEKVCTCSIMAEVGGLHLTAEDQQRMPFAATCTSDESVGFRQGCEEKEES